MNSHLTALNALHLPQQRSKEFVAVSLFSGGGGLDLGLSLAGFDFRYANDEVQYYCDTISYNFRDCVAQARDVRDLKGQEVREIIKSDKISLMVGGPPCQSFSILGQRASFSDLRGQLVFDYIRLINELQPEAFLFENVPGLLTLNGGEDWKKLYYNFQAETGYDIHTDTLNSADYGVPQIRKRVFVVGFRQPTQFIFPLPEYRNPLKLDLDNHKLLDWIPARIESQWIAPDELRNQEYLSNNYPDIELLDEIDSPTAVVDVSEINLRPFSPSIPEIVDLSVEVNVENIVRGRIRLRDKTRQHQEIIAQLATRLTELSYNLKDDPNSVDLLAEKNGYETIFEIKTINRRNFQPRIRLGVGQLSEYRYRRQLQTQMRPTSILVLSNTFKMQQWEPNYFSSEVNIGILCSKANSFLALTDGAVEQEVEY